MTGNKGGSGVVFWESVFICEGTGRDVGTGGEGVGMTVRIKSMAMSERTAGNDGRRSSSIT